MAFTIKQIANICKADFISAYKKEECINYLLTDSRSIVIADNCLFIALVSKYNDGHKYIEALYKKGIKNFIVSKNIELIDESGSIIKDVNIILVDNTLDALQKITSEHRKGFSYPLLTITGSNGRTIV
ncbi:MAG: bifunctional UDP-N-acetylmuramoyl-tripeptide:D-alanyl-D-alanine ligase/alanine racemase, partial [Bacteroidales bacterium]|nr:bifunctional UDP-N-acetylmuramoyl-tripeptide:D-alanyl-D-alanine ligase/alanine racemase [Bacteroidales bacterium]